MLRTNVEKLVKISVVGEVSSPIFWRSPYRISADGTPVVLPGVGGVTYNVRVGDPATGWEADHVEPSVSIQNKEKDERFLGGANMALNVLACVGNKAVVVSEDAKGAEGVVTGKHGGIEHVLVDFPPETLEKLLIGNKILIKAFGVGLKLLDYSDIRIMNLSPQFLETINPQPKKTNYRSQSHILSPQPSWALGSEQTKPIRETMTSNSSTIMPNKNTA